MSSAFHDKNLLTDFVAYLRINGLTSVAMADEKQIIDRYLELRFDIKASR